MKMTLSALALWLLEVLALMAIVSKYSKYLEVDEFLSRANLEDLLRVRHHSVNAFCLLCIATMGRLFEP
jgi:hypothetical protein